MKLSKNANIFIKLSILVLVVATLLFSTAFTQEISYRSYSISFKTMPDSIIDIAKRMMQENPNLIVQAISKKDYFINILIPDVQAKDFYTKHQTNKRVKKIDKGGIIKFPPSENKKRKKMEVNIGFFPSCLADSNLASNIVKKNHGSIKATDKVLNYLLVEVDLDKAEEFLLNIVENNSVKSVEFNYLMPAYLFYEPSRDPEYSSQWHLPKIKCPEAWDTTKGDSGVIVAILDTGVDYGHPDLRDNMWTDADGNYGYDFTIDPMNDPMDDRYKPMDCNGHGTHLAGIVAGVMDNWTGGCGVAPNVKIMPVKVLKNTSQTYSGGGGCAAQAILQQNTPNPDEILYYLNKFAGACLKDEYLLLLKTYNNEMLHIISQDASVRTEAARLFLKYEPAFRFMAGRGGSNIYLTSADIWEIDALIEKINAKITMGNTGISRDAELIDFFNGLRQLVNGSANKTFSDALRSSIFFDPDKAQRDTIFEEVTVNGLEILPEWVAAGITYAVDNGAKVINMSIGLTDKTPKVEDAIQYAYDNGCLLVGAAGNVYTDSNGNVIDSVQYPASSEKVIAVSATNRDDSFRPSSCYGPEIEISAPGEDILSTDMYSYSHYKFLSGTSMAAAEVSGAAALIRSYYPYWTCETVHDRLCMSAIDLGDQGPDDKFGYGILDANCVQPRRSVRIAVHSPVDLHVYDANGRHIGVNYTTGLVELQIPHALYSGPGTEPQTVKILDPGGKFNVVLVGNGTGSYSYSIQGLDNENVTTERAFSGMVTPNQVLKADFTVPNTKSPTATIDINAYPMAISNGPYYGNEGALVTLDGSGSFDQNDHIVSWLWDLDGDGVFETNATLTKGKVSHTWQDDFAGKISLKVIDANRAESIADTPLTIRNIAPAVEAGPDQTVKGRVEKAVFHGSYTDPGLLDTHTIEWDFGDGSTSAGVLNPTHTYASAGEYTVTLTVTDDNGGKGSDSLKIKVLNVDLVAVAKGPYIGDEGSPISFDGSASYAPNNQIVSWSWDLDGDGAFETNATNTKGIVSHTWPDDYTGKVSLKVVDGYGAINIANTTVTARNVPPAAEAGNDRIVECGIDTVSFKGNVTDPGLLDTHTIQWDFGDGTTANNTLTPAHKYSRAGEYTVTLTVTDDDGGKACDTLKVTAQDTTPPKLSITSGKKSLWPPTNKLIPVTLTISAQDACDGDLCQKVKLVSVTCDELNKNNKNQPDIVILNKNLVNLRAYRLGGGNGRVYRLNYLVTDASGNTATASIKITVPHDPIRPAIDSGIKYTVKP